MRKPAYPTEFVIDTNVTLTRSTASESYFPMAARGHGKRSESVNKKKTRERERELWSRSRRRAVGSEEIVKSRLVRR